MTVHRIVSFGEALVDFLPDHAGVPLREVSTFTKSVGGAPANVSVGIARLGGSVAHVGMVGADEFGHFLHDALREEGVDVSGLRRTTAAKTGITFISLSAEGDRSFLFFRERSAELVLRPHDIDVELIGGASVFIAGSNLLMNPDVREATYLALRSAREGGALVLLDPNVRLHLWADPDECRREVLREVHLGDVVKINEEELEFLVGTSGTAAALWDELAGHGASALIVTRAQLGAEAYTRDGVVSVTAPRVSVVDTTGAGDGFVAGVARAITRIGRSSAPHELRARVAAFDAEQWRRVLQVGCWVGTQVCTKLGATPALPTEDELPWSDLLEI